MFRIEHNIKTGEIKEIPLTPEEIVEKEKEALKAINKVAEEIQAEAAKATAKAALLERLGITEDEAKLLLG